MDGLNITNVFAPDEAIAGKQHEAYFDVNAM